jgi:NADPH2:quinone reductase
MPAAWDHENATQLRLRRRARPQRISFHSTRCRLSRVKKRSVNTAYQMMNRSARVKASQRVLIHGASGGFGTALLQLRRLLGWRCTVLVHCVELRRFRTSVVSQSITTIRTSLKEIHRLTSEGVDAVFDPIGGTHLWHSRKALRPGGKVVGYGLITSLRGEGLTSGRPGRRNRFRGAAIFGLYIAGGWLLPGRKQ